MRLGVASCPDRLLPGDATRLHLRFTADSVQAKPGPNRTHLHPASATVAEQTDRVARALALALDTRTWGSGLRRGTSSPSAARLRNEATFARLCDAAPIPAGSGKTDGYHPHGGRIAIGGRPSPLRRPHSA